MSSLIVFGVTFLLGEVAGIEQSKAPMRSHVDERYLEIS